MEMAMRLDKYLADMQIGTRSQVKKLIQKGFVQVNDEIIKKIDFKVNEDDIVVVDGMRVDYVSYEYYLLNKPAGFICATQDNRYPSVLELIPYVRKDIAIVGRLDVDTQGALLITNDGQLNHKLLSLKHHVDKKYYVEVDSVLPENAKEIFSQPMEFSDFTSQPALYEAIDDTSCFITIQEGKYHQVKRMFEQIGCTVTFLNRVQFGNLTIDGLEVGEYRELTAEEIQQLYEY